MSRLADLELESRDGQVLARVGGEIDQSNALSLGTTLTEAVPNQTMGLVLDLSNVSYFDSSGIQLIYELRGQLKARGQALRLVIPSGSSSHTALRLAGVTEHIEIFETAAEALASSTG